MSGYCCTGNVISARRPASAIVKLTTIASTGCFTKRSVNARIEVSFASERDGSRAAELRQPIGRERGRLLGRRVRIDRDERRVLQLERPGRGDELAVCEAAPDHDLVAEQRPGLDAAQPRPRGAAGLV